ncbi:MAG: ribosome-associated translation inhibitor RaiA [Phycisphaerae bacterium]|nr:ribosome-associated translation inhibitor RaiA [Phycisphaerae bacterium]
MQISVSGRHLELSAELRSYAESKAGKLTRFYDRLQAVEVVLDGEGNGFEAEVIATAEHKSVFVAKERGEDMYAAVDLVMDKIERQLTKHKERFRNRKHQGAKAPKAGDETETPST